MRVWRPRFDWLRRRRRLAEAETARLTGALGGLAEAVEDLRADVAAARGEVVTRKDLGASVSDLLASVRDELAAVAGSVGEGGEARADRLLDAVRQEIAAAVESVGEGGEAHANGLLDAVRAELTVLRQEIRADAVKDRDAIERVVRLRGGEAAALETRLRVATSGDLLAMEKRLRAGRGPSREASTAVRREVVQTLTIVQLIREHRPTVVLGLNATTSCVWAALTAREFGIEGGVVAVEHDIETLEATRGLLGDLGLDKVVEVRHAPILDLDLGGARYRWYAHSSFADVPADLLVVGRNDPVAGPDQYPALPLLAERMAGLSTVVLEVGDHDHGAGPDPVAAWPADRPEWTVRSPVPGGPALFTRAR